MMGPNHRLLFWVPPASRHAFYAPWTSSVTPREYPEIDLSRMAHGTHWLSCRDLDVTIILSFVISGAWCTI
ncbi:hypothetical protein BDR06DRAFT_68789 [Suillus hirtellus]|nr:hypothetical protein BDR06DRAFT_68789 [Suillus hirtellus]